MPKGQVEETEIGDPIEEPIEEPQEEIEDQLELETEEPQETPEAEVPEVQPVIAQQPKRTFQSPYAGQQPTGEDEELEQLLGTRGMELIERRIEQRLQQHTVAIAQQRQAVSQLNMPPALIDEFAPDMMRYEAGVPQNLRGTREGAIIALNSAITERMMQSDDPSQVLAQLGRHFQGQPQQQLAQTKQPIPVIPPESRMTSPRGGTARQIPQHVKPNQGIRDMWKANGLSDREVDELLGGVK